MNLLRPPISGKNGPLFPPAQYISLKSDRLLRQELETNAGVCGQPFQQRVAER